MKQGYFITLEGPDGCGKTTQLEFFGGLYPQRRSREVLTTREPGGVAAAEKIRQSPTLLKLAPRAETLLYLVAWGRTYSRKNPAGLK